MLELRYYQRDALDALYAYWRNGGGNGLIVLPTGAGKALVIAKLIEELLAEYPDMRILNVTHSAPLVEQNFKEFIGLLPFAPAGIYSAGLNRRDAGAQVLFCGIQSVWNKVALIGEIDLVIVDEAHAISRNTNTQYGKFFSEVRELNPDSRTCGTTATDYRMDSGRLTDDLEEEPLNEAVAEVVAELTIVKKFKLFDDVVYEIGLGELIEKGYLTRLTSQKTTSKIDLKGIGTRGGEYIPGQVSEAAERIIEAAIAEDMVLSEGRRAGLFFSTSKDNANHVAEAIRRHGRTCAVLTSDNAHQTKEIFEGFRSGKYWAISSVSMITTGTNFPFVDFISLILSTKSPGKLVQILGRGTRNCAGKVDCLVADHGRNLAYHGPIDQIRPREPGKGLGEQPKKVCPSEDAPDAVQDVNGNWGCGEAIPISIMTCQCCGYVFPPSEEEKITAHADTKPVLSSEKPWHDVMDRTFRHHPGKDGKPDSVKCTYLVGLRSISEWHCCAHTGYPKSKADRWWLAHGGNRPFPKTPIEWLERQHELAPTIEVQLDYSKNPKYPDVAAHRVGAANDNVPPAANDNVERRGMADWERQMDDDIPF
ncbi:DEAD/DEAH box helicase [Agrobacterium rhizogenes]|uniref:DEAD/DEAH box helicase n=1 Tax=Rhizobium rhizogenes TaxID=359 RepID=UPI0015718911|nr:DEAD/DEAH box helicase [Rhizobium rhizogenes]NTG85836.1 DEAD/DEAH box helicase [Rhizobium rhizogenes]